MKRFLLTLVLLLIFAPKLTMGQTLATEFQLTDNASFEIAELNPAEWNGELVLLVDDYSRIQRPSIKILNEKINGKRLVGEQKDAVILVRVENDNQKAEMDIKLLARLVSEFSKKFGSPKAIHLKNAEEGRLVHLLGKKKYLQNEVAIEPSPIPVKCGGACSRLVWERKKASGGSITITGGLDCLDMSLYFGNDWANCNVPNYNVACPARCVCNETYSTIETVVCANLPPGTRTNGNCTITWTNGNMVISIDSGVTHGTCVAATGTPVNPAE